MAVSAHEALYNAQANFETVERQNPALKKHPQFMIGKSQLDNVIKHLEADKGIYDEID